MAATAYADPGSFCGTSVPRVWNATPRSLFGDCVILAFLLAQCLDGVFTYIGVVSFGLAIEANPIVSSLMAEVGHGAGLVGAKGVAALLGIGLHLRQVHGAVAALTAFYVVAALVPWMSILF